MVAVIELLALLAGVLAALRAWELFSSWVDQ